LGQTEVLLPETSVVERAVAKTALAAEATAKGYAAKAASAASREGARTGALEPTKAGFADALTRVP